MGQTIFEKISDDVKLAKHENDLIGHLSLVTIIQMSSPELTDNIFDNESALSKIKDQLVKVLCDQLYGDIQKRVTSLTDSLSKYYDEKSNVFLLNELRNFKQVQKDMAELKEIFN